MVLVDKKWLRGLAVTGYFDPQMNILGEGMFRLSESNDSYPRGDIDIVSCNTKVSN